MKETKAKNKPTLTKGNGEAVWDDDSNKVWQVKKFKLSKLVVDSDGYSDPMFLCVAEKIPFDALEQVKQSIEESVEGVYVAHDSVGQARYIGRGNIFVRLKSHKVKYPLELQYFSFYVLKDKSIERQIETILIHVAGAGLLFNKKKKRGGNETHNPCDFEEGTIYFERLKKDGTTKVKQPRKRKTRTRPIRVSQNDGSE
jgi:hypothetical protein